MTHSVLNEYAFDNKDPASLYIKKSLSFEKLSFGTTISRYRMKSKLELSRLSSVRHYTKPDTFITKLLKKPGSKRGSLPLVPRFQTKLPRVPSPTRYQPPFLTAAKDKCSYPFNSKIEYWTAECNMNPGPGTYNLYTKLCRKIGRQFNFGKPSMKSCVKTFCSITPKDVCHQCGDICTKDYWFKPPSTYMCHFCWQFERMTTLNYTLDQIYEFQKIRTCEHIHDHQGTNHPTTILTDKQRRLREELENYLSLFSSCSS